MLPQGSRFMDKAVRILERDPNTVLVYPGMKFFGATSHRPFISHYDEKSVLVRNSIPSCTVYRTDEALAVGGYDNAITYGEDQELGLAMLAARFTTTPNAPRRVRRLLSETYLYRQYGTDGQNLSNRNRNLPDWPAHMAQLITRAGPLFDYHYGTQDQSTVRRMFLFNGTNLVFAFARRLQACLTGERPLSDLIKIPKSAAPS